MNKTEKKLKVMTVGELAKILTEFHPDGPVTINWCRDDGTGSIDHVWVVTEHLGNGSPQLNCGYGIEDFVTKHEHLKQIKFTERKWEV
jgi:hypothetical protein